MNMDERGNYIDYRVLVTLQDFDKVNASLFYLAFSGV